MQSNPPELDALLQERVGICETEDNVDAERGSRPAITLANLFTAPSEEVIRTLQTDGIIKLGEFKSKSDVVYAAFDGASMLTLGQRDRFVNYEQLWRRELSSRAGTPRGSLSSAADIYLEAYVVNVSDAADPDKDGLLQPMLRQWQSGGVSMEAFSLPALQATISFKWDTFARRLLLWQLCFFLIWTTSFFAFTWIFQDEDLDMPLSSLVLTRSGAATVALELLSLLAMVPFMILELGTLQAYGVYGWSSIWNLLDMATYLVQLSVIVMHVARIGLRSSILSTLLALQCIFLLFRVQYFSRVFKSTRFAYLDVIKETVSSVRHYFGFLLVIMFGFAASFHILFRMEQDTVTNFDTMPHAFLKIYSSQTGLDYEEMLGSQVPLAATLINAAYTFIMGMVLLNLLIGLMTAAMAKVTEEEEMSLLLNQAQIIDELEATMPRWLEEQFEGLWYPKFVHVLRINTEKIIKVDMDALWVTEMEGENADVEDMVKDTTKAVNARLERIEAQLARLEGYLQRTAHGAGEITDKNTASSAS